MKLVMDVSEELYNEIKNADDNLSSIEIIQSVRNSRPFKKVVEDIVSDIIYNERRAGDPNMRYAFKVALNIIRDYTGIS